MIFLMVAIIFDEFESDTNMSLMIKTKVNLYYLMIIKIQQLQNMIYAIFSSVSF